VHGLRSGEGEGGLDDLIGAGLLFGFDAKETLRSVMDGCMSMSEEDPHICQNSSCHYWRGRSRFGRFSQSRRWFIRMRTASFVWLQPCSRRFVSRTE